MDYAAARAAFFNPREAETTESGPVSPARALRDAMEPIATICFWSKPANDAYAALGLDFLSGYIWGRASSLGEPGPSVVAAAFGVFEPGLIANQYAAGRAIADLESIRAARESGSVAALETVLGAPEGLADAVQALRRGIDAADPTARPFFAGLNDVPWPEHPLGELWHATAMLRELRGDAHLATCAAAGLSGLQANLLTEMWVGWEEQAYTGTRGWSAEAMNAATARLRERGLVSENTLSAAGKELRAQIEETTDRLMDPCISAIGPDLTGLLNSLTGWSAQIIEAGWFPPDPFKRASG